MLHLHSILRQCRRDLYHRNGALVGSDFVNQYRSMGFWDNFKQAFQQELDKDEKAAALKKKIKETGERVTKEKIDEVTQTTFSSTVTKSQELRDTVSSKVC